MSRIKCDEVMQAPGWSTVCYDFTAPPPAPKSTTLLFIWANEAMTPAETPELTPDEPCAQVWIPEGTGGGAVVEDTSGFEIDFTVEINE